ncbi:unnamed protein product [Jaminaea pallidilutea]
MLLRLEPAPSRAAGEAEIPMGTRGRKRPYEWLRVTENQASIRKRETGASVAPRDLLHALPLNTPTELTYLPGVKVRVTLIDANHMPGAVMFLVEGHRGAVLHTGDCRAEKWWLDALVRHPALQRYTSWEEAIAVAATEERDDHLLVRSQAEQIDGSQTQDSLTSVSASASSLSTDGITSAPRKGNSRTGRDSLRLRNIYLDDEHITSADWPMTKKDGAIELIRLMERYPPDTTFFIDMWTWGYEEIYVAIGKSFQRRGRGPKIHVDRYKRQMYDAADDAALPFLTTKASHNARFHACERRGPCEHLSRDEQLVGERDAFESLSQQWTGPAPLPLGASQTSSLLEKRSQSESSALVVYVKPIASSKKAWRSLSSDLHRQIDCATKGEGVYPSWLACPMDRHSTLPELQRFVRAFRPATLTPTTSDPSHYFLAAKYLGPALGPGGQSRIDAEGKAFVGAKHWAKYEEALRGDIHGEGSDTVADEIARFRENIRQTLDLSQDPRSRADDGYDADVSGMPAGQSARPPSPTSGRPTKRLHLSAVDPVTVPLPVAGPSRLPPQLVSSPHAPNLSFAIEAPSEASGSTTLLDDDLARRYFIVLRMFIQPGLRLKNLPGGTECPRAWRAVRKLRPDYARATEETMMKELGILPPPWIPTPPVTPVEQTAKRPVTAREGAAVLAPHQMLQQEVKWAIAEERTRMERDQPDEEDEGRQEAAQADEAGRVSVSESTANRIPDEDERDDQVFSGGSQPQHAALPAIDASIDWLESVQTNFIDPEAWPNLAALHPDEACALANQQRDLSKSALASALYYRNAQAVLTHYAPLIVPKLQPAMAQLSLSLVADSSSSPALIEALARLTEQHACFCAVLLTREARSVIDDGLRARLRSCLSGISRVVQSYDIKWSSGSGAPQHWTSQQLRDVTARLRRTLAALSFAENEAQLTSMPYDPEDAGPTSSKADLGRDGVEGTASAQLALQYKPPHHHRSINNRDEGLLVLR